MTSCTGAAVVLFGAAVIGASAATGRWPELLIAAGVVALLVWADRD